MSATLTTFIFFDDNWWQGTLWIAKVFNSGLAFRYTTHPHKHSTPCFCGFTYSRAWKPFEISLPWDNKRDQGVTLVNMSLQNPMQPEEQNSHSI